MAIEIQETFEVHAPVDEVWTFISTPNQVVGCLPGASLTEEVDDRNFKGKVKIKLGAVTAAYKGKIQFKEVDGDNHKLVMEGKGKDPSGGTAKAEVTVQLVVTASGATEMSTDAAIDLTGKVMQVGGGMIKGVSHQLFQQFANTAKERLEAAAPGGDAGAAGAEGAGAATARAVAPTSEENELKVLPLLFKTLMAAIVNFFRRLFGGGKSN
ncbi:MAG: SRPBCC family protein [Myxococcota bacterium]|jgi:hypothetical protein|nr:SRPBCC family protein [Myxococcota bacterium]